MYCIIILISLREESCGQCTPCRVGCQQLLKGVEAVKRGDKNSKYLDELVKLAKDHEAGFQSADWVNRLGMPLDPSWRTLRKRSFIKRKSINKDIMVSLSINGMLVKVSRGNDHPGGSKRTEFQDPHTLPSR